MSSFKTSNFLQNAKKESSFTIDLTKKIKEIIRELGFDLFGIIPVFPPKTIDFYQRWLLKGYAGEMLYLEKHFEKKKDLRYIMTEVRTLISLALNYHTEDPPEALRNDPSRGKISRYAWGYDYHDLIKKKLKILQDNINTLVPDGNIRFFTDTGPILEREFAQMAGLGWFGKNSSLINHKNGSWFFIAEVLLNFELEYDNVPKIKGGCGQCRKCVEACPTGAILSNGSIDANRCISYLTIENREIIPYDLRPLIDNWICGCDICQEVCPWNRKTPVSGEKSLYPLKSNFYPELVSFTKLTQEEFSKRFKGSSIKRLKRKGLLRNVAVALGNWKNRQAIPLLKEMMEDTEALVRAHAAWALGQIPCQESKEILIQALDVEKVDLVIEEIRRVIS